MSWGQRSKRQALGLVLAALGATGCGATADASVPVSLGPFVEAARASLRSNQDGLVRSEFRFRSARCRADGGLVLLFEQFGPSGSQGTAVAMSGRPHDDASAWAGGFAPVDPVTDPEIRAFFAEAPEVPCP